MKLARSQIAEGDLKNIHVCLGSFVLAAAMSLASDMMAYVLRLVSLFYFSFLY
jgi:hypothetical protein